MTGPSSTSAFAVEALGRSVLFARVSPEALEACAANLRVRRYRRGETIFHQGDPGDSLYIIESGSVKIVLPSPEGEEGAIIATLGRGDFFGELALLTRQPRSASIRAVDYCNLYTLEKREFDLVLDKFPEFAEEVRRVAAHRRGDPQPERG